MKKTIFNSLIFLMLYASVLASDVVINEIMYNSDGPDVEFIELYNTTAAEIDLTGWTLMDDNESHTPCQLTGSIAAGGYFLIAGSLSLFQTQYPGTGPVNGNDYDTGDNAWSFGNGGDVVNLYDAAQNLHDCVAYEDGGSWPSSADGDGASLELLHPSLDNENPTSWDPSAQSGGTPGQMNSVFTTNVMPVCKNGDRNIDLPGASDEVTVTVKAYDNEGLASVELMVNTGAGYAALPMNDRGSGADEAAGDSIFTAVIPAQSDGVLVQYYAIATDDIGQMDLWPNDAPEKYHAYTVGYTPPNLKINEVLAINTHINNDENGEFDDWFELYNAGDVPVDIGGLFVSSSLSSSQSFRLPNYILGSGEYLLIWADDDEEQGQFHTDFKLSGDGEAVALFETVNHGNVLIHGWKFGRMGENVSMGLQPADGTAPEYLAVPTPGASNESSPLFSNACINEFESTSDFGGPDDWIEIYNRGRSDVDLSGCFLSDNRGNNTKWTFPDETVLEPGAFLVIYEDVLEFGWSSEGDDVIMLTASDSTTGLDFYDFGPQRADHSEGRFPDGVGVWQQFEESSLGAPNIGLTDAAPAVMLPQSIALQQNYPNPFNPVTTLTFTLSHRGRAAIHIYNAMGQQVSQLTDRIYQAGTYQIIWNAGHLPSGHYWVEMNCGGLQQTRKMVLLK